MDKSINWFYNYLGKTFYSMTQRNGQIVNGKYGFDCSSSVYYALIHGGLLPNIRIGNTDSLFNDLERNGWTKLGPNAQGNYDTKRGDVFIWGVRGASGGAAGHTGMFINENDIIHCSYGNNGIAINNYDQMAGWNGWPYPTFYRYTGAQQQLPSVDNNDQLLDIGSTISFNKFYTVDELQHVGGIWQARTNELAPVGFTWEGNGIPVELLVEVDGEGYATEDQLLYPGSRYKLPGKYKVLDLTDVGRWMAMIEWNGLKFWVDIETASEIRSNEEGASTPGKRPAPPAEPTKEEPVKETEPVKPVEEPKPEPEKGPAKEEETKPEPPKEETKVAFTQEEQKELAVQTQKTQAIADDVADQESVKQITDSIPQKVKVAVYVVGDSLIGAGLLVPGLAVVFETGTVQQVSALAGVLATAGAFVLTMFGIYKSGKK